MTLDLFDATIELRPSLARLEEDALAAIARVLAAGHPVVVAYSAGKDSTACVALTLQAARDLVAKGLARPQIVVLNSDTRVENPKIRSLVSSEMAKMRAFAKRHLFGVKGAALSRLKTSESVASFDSMAFDFSARVSARTGRTEHDGAPPGRDVRLG